MATESNEMLEYADVQRALERCMAANPTDGAEHRLSKDASLIADILGEMIYLKVERLPSVGITEKRMQAFLRWQVAASAGANERA